jgi:hypothetical protein
MRHFAALVTTSLFAVSYFLTLPRDEVTGSKSARPSYPLYNPQVLDQCVDVCVNAATLC